MGEGTLPAARNPHKTPRTPHRRPLKLVIPLGVGPGRFCGGGGASCAYWGVKNAYSGGGGGSDARAPLLRRPRGGC